MASTKTELEQELFELRKQIDATSSDYRRFWLMRSKTFFFYWFLGAALLIVTISHWTGLSNPFGGESTTFAILLAGLYLVGFLVHCAMLMRQKVSLGAELSEAKTKLNVVLEQHSKTG